jgi:hypothetical protein
MELEKENAGPASAGTRGGGGGGEEPGGARGLKDGAVGLDDELDDVPLAQRRGVADGAGAGPSLTPSSGGTGWRVAAGVVRGGNHACMAGTGGMVAGVGPGGRWWWWRPRASRDRRH